MTMFATGRRGLAVFAALGLCTGAAVAKPHCSAANASNAVLCSVDPAIDALALCNDGTQPAFWVRPGHGAGADRWVIWLQGGGECTDALSCATRAGGSAAQFLTSSGFTANRGTGLLSADQSINPALHNANAVFVHYCSSDDWSGAHRATGAFDAADPATWNFQGRRIALAVIATLKELKLGFSGARQILLGGSSAGGIGIVSLANDMLPALPPTHDVRLANDAGFIMDIGQFDAALPAPHVTHAQPNAFEAYFAGGRALWQGRGDAKCDAAAQTRLAHVDCYDTGAVMRAGSIALPSFVAEARLDTAQLTRQICGTATNSCGLPQVPTTPQGVYATAFGSRMASALKGPGTAAAYAVYAPDAYMHVMLNDDQAFVASNEFLGRHLAARDVFDAWLHQPRASRIVDIGNAPGVAGGS